MNSEYSFKIPREKMTQFLLKFRDKMKTNIHPLTLEIYQGTVCVKYSGRINKDEMEYIKEIALPYYASSLKNTKIVITEKTRTEI